VTESGIGVFSPTGRARVGVWDGVNVAVGVEVGEGEEVEVGDKVNVVVSTGVWTGLQATRTKRASIIMQKACFII
jgi:hypothetical protein